MLTVVRRKVIKAVCMLTVVHHEITKVCMLTFVRHKVIKAVCMLTAVRHEIITIFWK
jgi:hypothetical protein